MDNKIDMLERFSQKLSRKKQINLIKKSPYFDSPWYLSQYKDVKEEGIEPISHYLEHGSKEGRNPSQLFCTDWYMESNPDIKKLNINPLLHFIKYGHNEGRLPKPPASYTSKYYAVAKLETLRTRLEYSGRDKAIFILGNGPSMRGFDFNLLDNHVSIGMNVAFRHWHRINWYPNYYICLDTVMIETQKESINELVEKYSDRISLFILRKNILKYYPKLIKYSHVIFLEDYLDTLYFSGIKKYTTTGSFSLLFTSMIGYKICYLLGIDLNQIERIPESQHVEGHVLEIAETPTMNPNYFIDDYQKKGEKYNIPNSNMPDLHQQSWRAVNSKLQAFNVTVLNLNKNSKLDIFEFTDFHKIII